jgi:hypothetical protein
MSFYSRTFRKELPDELVIKFFRLVGVKDINDTKFWQKSVLSPATCELFNKMLVELEPFYYPHKLFLIRREMNQNRYVQILRQLAKVKGKVLESKEYVVSLNQKKKKCLMFRFRPETKPDIVSEETFIVRFE